MTKQCAYCGAEYQVKPSAAGKSSYCSRVCMAEGYKTRLTGKNNPNFKSASAKTCERCGSVYHSYNKTRRFCSQSCAGKAISTSEKMSAKSLSRAGLFRLVRIKAVKRGTCSVCGCPTSGVRKYCRNCTTYGKRKFSQCVECGRKFKGQTKTCGPICLSRWRAKIQRGENSHRWQGGKTAATMIERCSQRYSEWRSSVFCRDNYTCAMCGSRGGRLTAHHIKPWATHTELRYCPGNGITLCWPCHASIKGKEAEYESRFVNQVDVVSSFEEAWAVIEREAKKAGRL